MIEGLLIFASWCQISVWWLIITTGTLFLVLVCMMLASEAIRRILEHFGGYALLMDFAWHREEFKKWRGTINETRKTN